MNGRRELRKFRRGEGCDECPARRWYAESGFRYCENGHRIEGFIEFEHEDEENFGNKGHVARKAKERREKELRHLSGNAAKELYLECLQLILRKQIAWLVNEKSLPAELETVVRDMWELRVRDLAGLKSADGRDGEDGQQSGSGAETTLYSSQSEGEVSDASVASSASHRRIWRSEVGERWKMPRLLDTLALCYLGTLLLRLPYRVGDFQRWAKADEILYLGAVEEIPKEMRDRLPGVYQRTLLTRNAIFRGGELQDVVLDLVRAYHINYDMVFPGLNLPLLLYQYAKELGLPAEVFGAVVELLSFLNEDLTYPLEKRSTILLDHPDVFLISCIVFVTKLLHPFDKIERARSVSDDITTLRIDWDEWQRIYAPPAQDGLSRHEVEKLRSEDAWLMSDATMDEYLDWYQQLRLPEIEDGRQITKLFPLSAIGRRDKMGGDEADEVINEKARESQRSLQRVEPQDQNTSASKEARPFGQLHQMYREEEELPAAAKAFYDRAAELSGISTPMLVRSVRAFEKRMAKWTQLEAARDRSKAAEAEGASAGK